MSHTVTYYRWSDKKPDDGQEIWYIYNNQWCEIMEVLFGKAEWQWEQVDENGRTGTSASYNGEDPNDLEVEGYMLTVFISGFHEDLECVRWCPADAFDHMFD